MKKDKTEKIHNSLNEYLKKRNYEAINNMGEASEKEAGMLSLLDDPCPDSFSFSATSANHLHVEHQFARFKSWMMEASEPCRSELSQLLFPLFVHLYIELMAVSGRPAANAFFNRNFQVFKVNRDYEQTLRQIVSSSADASAALVRTLRMGRYQVRLSDSSTLNYLLRYLRTSSNPTIVQILHQYIDIELDDGLVPSSVFAALPHSAAATTNLQPPQDCSADELAAVEAAIGGVQAMPHPGLSLALYTVVNAYNGVCSASTAPNVDMLACGFEDSVIKMWSLTAHWSGGTARSSSNTSNTLLSCDDARLDDPLTCPQQPEGEEGATSTSSRRKQASGGEVWSLRGHSGAVYDVAFTHDSTHLLSVSEDTYMRLWDVNAGHCVAKYSGHNYPVFRVAVAPHTVHVATASYDLTARLWSLEYLHSLRVFAGHSASVTAVAFHHNCSYLATGAWDGTVRLWQVADANAVRILLHHAAPVTSLAFAPHGRYLASGSEDCSVVVWDLAAGKVLMDLTSFTANDTPSTATAVSGREAAVALSWSADSSLLVVGGEDGTVRTIAISKAPVEGVEVHSVPCGSDTTLLHATLTRNNYIAAVVAQQQDK